MIMYYSQVQKIKEEKEKYWNEKVKYDFEIPDKNIALAFLQQAMKLLKKDMPRTGNIRTCRSSIKLRLKQVLKNGSAG